MSVRLSLRPPMNYSTFGIMLFCSQIEGRDVDALLMNVSRARHARAELAQETANQLS